MDVSSYQNELMPFYLLAWNQVSNSFILSSVIAEAVVYLLIQMTYIWSFEVEFCCHVRNEISSHVAMDLREVCTKVCKRFPWCNGYHASLRNLRSEFDSRWGYILLPFVSKSSFLLFYWLIVMLIAIFKLNFSGVV